MASPTSLEDRVRALLASGDVRAAVDEVMRDLGPPVRSSLRAIVRDGDEAWDAYQSFAEDVMRGLPSFRFESSLRTWALRIALHAAFEFQRQPWRRRARRLLSREASELADRHKGSSELRLERRRQEVARLRAELSAADQTLLTLRIDQDLSWEEASEVLQGTGEPVTPAALAKRFERLTKRLRKLAERDGLLESESRPLRKRGRGRAPRPR